MNYRVHSFIKGYLTLKFSESWKIVTFPFSPFVSSLALSSKVILGFLFSLLSDIGIVSRGTGELGLI